MRIHPSILSADFLSLAEELDSISSADAVHVDVMDNNFVPNLTFGQEMVRQLGKKSTLPLDLHLMIANPDKWAPEFAEIGAGSVTFHLEAATDAKATLKRIKQIGPRAAIAIKPDTPVQLVEDLIPHLDMLLIMTVEPGFGGQSLLTRTLPKISQARELFAAAGVDIAIQVDGGVTESNIAELAELGADIFVAGNAIFRHEDRDEKIHQLRQAASRGH